MGFKYTMMSMFQLHNETVNFWTHFLGFWVMLALSIWWWLEEPNPSLQPKWPHFVFVLAIMYTLCVSSFAHLFYIVSSKWNSFVWRLDHTGIAVGCAGAFFPICIYVFNCSSTWLAPFYLTITCVIAAVVILCSMMDIFHTMAFRPYRLGIQMSFAVWSQVPMIHAMVLMAPHPEPRLALVLVWVAISLEIIGGVIYGARVTEKLFPRYVDLIGSSHNIMHCFVLAGHIVFYFAGRMLWKGTCVPLL